MPSARTALAPRALRSFAAARHTALRVTSPIITAFALAACGDATPLPSAPDAAPLYAKPGGTSTSIVVTSNLADGYSISSDALGDYRNGIGGVVSQLQPVGDWEMDTQGRRSTRSVRLDFSNVVSGSAPFANKLVKGRFISKLSDVGGHFPTMQVGDTILTPLSFAFVDGSTNYGVRFNPANQPGSEYARATCTAAISATNTGCAAWELTPSGADGTSLAVLQNVTTNSTAAIVRMSFRITFRR